MEVTNFESNGIAEPSAWTAEVLEGWLLEHADAIGRGHEIDPGADLFAQGLDR